jgi:ankyrin repeat protein
MSSTPSPFEAAGTGAKSPAELNEALIQASRANNAELLETLLQEGADPNVCNTKGVPVLLIAAHFGHEKVVQKLLSHPEINPNIQNPQGVTALHFAAQAGYLEIVEALLAHEDIDPTLRNSTDISALDLAMSKGRSEIVEKINTKIIEEDFKKTGNLPFHYQGSIIELSKALGLETDPEGICFGFALQTALSELVNEPEAGILSLSQRLLLLPIQTSKQDREDPNSAFQIKIQALADEIKSIPATELGSRIISTEDPNYVRKKALAELEQWLINLNFTHDVGAEKTEKIMPKWQIQQNHALKKELLTLFLPPSINPEAFNLSKTQLRIFSHNEKIEAWLKECEEKISRLDPSQQKPISFMIAIDKHAISIHYHPSTKDWRINDANTGIIQYSHDKKEQLAMAIHRNLLFPAGERLTYMEVSAMGEFPRAFLEELNDPRSDEISKDIDEDPRTKWLLITRSIRVNDTVVLEKFLADPRTELSVIQEALDFAKKRGTSKTIITIMEELITRESPRTLGELFSSKFDSRKFEENLELIKKITEPYTEILKRGASPEETLELQKTFPQIIQNLIEQRNFLEKLALIKSTDITPENLHKIAAILLKTERIMTQWSEMKELVELYTRNPLMIEIISVVPETAGHDEEKGSAASSREERLREQIYLKNISDQIQSGTFDFEDNDESPQEISEVLEKSQEILEKFALMKTLAAICEDPELETILTDINRFFSSSDKSSDTIELVDGSEDDSNLDSDSGSGSDSGSDADHDFYSDLIWLTFGRQLAFG